MEEQVPQRVYAHIVVIRKNGSAGPVFKLTEKLCLIGRDPDKCLIRVIRPEVSHVHAQLSVNDTGVVSITNLSRTNLTIVNGTYIKSDIVLKDDDVFTIGMRSFKFRYPTENETILVTKKSSRKLPENLRDEETMDFGALKSLQQQQENNNVQEQQQKARAELKAVDRSDAEGTFADKPEEKSTGEDTDAPVVEESVVEAPVEEPVVQESIVEAPTAEAPVEAVVEPSAEKSIVKAPTEAEVDAEEQIVEAPAEAEITAEEPIAETPTEAEAVVEAPVIEAPAVEAPAEEPEGEASAEASVEGATQEPTQTPAAAPTEEFAKEDSMDMDDAQDSVKEPIQNDPEASLEPAAEIATEADDNDDMEVAEETVPEKPITEEFALVEMNESSNVLNAVNAADAEATVSYNMQVDQETEPADEAVATEKVPVAVDDNPTFEQHDLLKAVLADVLMFPGLKPKQVESAQAPAPTEKAEDEDDIGDIIINKASSELPDESQFLTQHVTTESDILQNPRSLPRVKRSHSLRGQVRPRSISFHMHSQATSAEMSSQPQFQTLMEEESLDMVPEDESVQHVSPSPFGIAKMQQRGATRGPRQLDSDDESFAIHHMHFEAPESSGQKESESDAESFAIHRMHIKAKNKEPAQAESDTESFAIQRMHTKAKTRAPKEVESDGEEYGIRSLHPDQSFDSSMVTPGAQERLDAVSMEVCPSAREDALSDVEEETQEMHFSQLYGEESMFSAAEGEQQDPTEVSVIESSETYQEKANTGYEGDNEAPMSVRTEEPETAAEESFAEDSLMDVGDDQVAEFVVDADPKQPEETDQSAKFESLAALVSPIPEVQKQEVDTVENVAADDAEGDAVEAAIASAVPEIEEPVEEAIAAEEMEGSVDATIVEGNAIAADAGVYVELGKDDEAPAETTVTKELDAEVSREEASDAPADDAPVGEASATEAEVDVPVEETVVDGDSAADAPMEDTQIEQDPVKDAAVELDTPAEDTPVEEDTTAAFTGEAVQDTAEMDREEAEDHPTDEATAEPVEEASLQETEHAEIDIEACAAKPEEDPNPKKEAPASAEAEAVDAPAAEETVVLGEMFDHTKLQEAGFESDMVVPMSVAKALEEELNAAEEEEDVSEEEDAGVKYNLRNRDNNEEEEEEIAPPKKKQRRRRGDRRKNKVEVDVENDADNTENASSNSKRKTRSKSKASSHDHVEKTPGKRSLRARKSREMYDEPAESEDAPRRSKRSRAGLR